MPRSLKVACVEAGQQRDRDDLGRRAAPRSSPPQHLVTARRMDRQDRGLERRKRVDRFGDRIGNVVKLEVEEDRQAQIRRSAERLLGLAPRRIPGRASRRLRASRTASAMRQRAVEVGRVDGDEDRVHATGSASSAAGRVRREARRSGCVPSPRSGGGAPRSAPAGSARSAGSPIRNTTSSSTGSLMSAWMSPHRFSVTSDPIAAGEQGDEHRDQDPEKGLQKLHGGAV